MSGLKYLERFQRVEHLIQRRATGSPGELANRLGVSERTVYRIIDDLKILNLKPIRFSRSANSYIFFEK